VPTDQSEEPDLFPVSYVVHYAANNHDYQHDTHDCDGTTISEDMPCTGLGIMSAV